MGRIEELFAADGIAHQLGVELVGFYEPAPVDGAAGSEQARVELAMAVDERHIGWHGRCHGGVLFTVADIAMSYLGNRFAEMAYAVHASIELLRGVETGDQLTVTAVETARQGRAAIIDATITRRGSGNGPDQVVAVFRGNTLTPGAQSPQKLG